MRQFFRLSLTDLVQDNECAKAARHHLRVEKAINQRNAVLHAIAQQAGDQRAEFISIFAELCFYGGFFNHCHIVKRAHIRHAAISVASIKIATQQVILLAVSLWWQRGRH